jgi:DNA-3-methyladenine glycosylase II
MFNLNFDLTPFYDVSRGDNILAGLVRRLRGLKSLLTATPFEALIDSVIEQQISLTAAHVLQRKLIKSLGDKLTIEGEHYYIYPSAAKLAETFVDQLRQMGLSRNKAEYIRQISGLVCNGQLDLEKFRNYSDVQAAERELVEVKGIGIWTAEMTLVRGLGKLEALPADDIGLRRAISLYYRRGDRVSSQEVRQIAEKMGGLEGTGRLLSDYG